MSRNTPERKLFSPENGTGYERMASPELKANLEKKEARLQKIAGDLKDLEGINQSLMDIEKRSESKKYSDAMDDEVIKVFAATGAFFVDGEDKASIFFRIAGVLSNWATWSKENGLEDFNERLGVAQDATQAMLEVLEKEKVDEGLEDYSKLKGLSEVLGQSTPIPSEPESRASSRAESRTPVASPELFEGHQIKQNNQDRQVK